MTFLRRILVLAAFTAGAAVFAGPGLSARPGASDFTLSTAHFVIHYQSDPLTTYAITQTQASDIASLAEHAYATEIADGFPAPPSDNPLGGDSKIDIEIVDPGSLSGALGATIADTANPQTTAWIALDGSSSDALSLHTIAHEIFHVFQVGVWNSSSVTDNWLYEGSAEWMGYRVDGYLVDSGGFLLGPDEMALDCLDPYGTSQCDLTSDYIGGGYSRWPFFEYLAEKFGASFVNSAFAHGASGAPDATDALSQALIAKGTTLADTYDAWSATELTSGYSIKALQGLKPQPTGGPLLTGSTSGSLGSRTVPVNHLSTRYIEFDRGDGDPAKPCFAATLSLSVALPAGTSSKPMFYWNAKDGSLLTPLSVNGNTATAAIPWDTCTWPAAQGYLELPNASSSANGGTAVDGADFAVSASLAVDTSRPTAPTAPPAQWPTWGPIVPAPTSDQPPAITVYGPGLLRLATSDRQLRLIVESSGSGLLQAQIGSTALGSGSLRPGTNDLRFTVPAALLASLRRSAAANTLTLTPVSPSGSITGTPVTREVLLAPAAHPAKHSAKKKLKPHK